MKKNPLGRGLDALLGDNSTEKPEILQLRISQVSPNRNQPRKDFSEAAMDELTESVRRHGVIQPILVTQGGAGYTIVAGERRWRAARAAGLTEIPAVLCDYDEVASAEVALIENLQREGLNPVEEAMGYKSLVDNHGFTQEKAAERVGKPRSSVANSLRLLALPGAVLELLRDGSLSAGHAKVLLGLDSEEDRVGAARAAVQKGMSVRELEAFVKSGRGGSSAAGRAKRPARDGFYDEYELAMKQKVGRSVRVSAEPKGKKPGRLEIEFFDKDDLTALSKTLFGDAE